jgi:hypothetical protein
VLRHIAKSTEFDQGAGAIPGVIRDALKRIIGFEIQFGPFAVAQLRLLAEIGELLKAKATVPASVRPRLYVTNTLGNPDEEHEYIPQILMALAQSRRQANAIKRSEPITVVIGNPPYWIESGTGNTTAPLNRWIAPPEWGVSAHSKHLRNLYIYFWRWATWKVFGDGSDAPQAAPDRKGVVCFITVAGFLNGPGFQKMRDDLRRTADEIWVVDCSPEGHQPAVNTRVFQAVQQPVCIVLVARMANGSLGKPARVRFTSLPPGPREEKFAALSALKLDGEGWADCLTDWRAPFLPAATGGWGTYIALDDFFIYNGSGVQPGRTWVIAPDQSSLASRWQALISATDITEQNRLFHVDVYKGSFRDRYPTKLIREGLPGHEHRLISVSKDKGPPIKPVRYGFRSFNRQWILPDNRLINRPNPALWPLHSGKQIYLTALTRHAPSSGPALTFTCLIPDYDHYQGSFGGRVFPLWADDLATKSNVQPSLLEKLGETYATSISAEDIMAYIAAVAAHPAYVRRFVAHLIQPGLRIPLTGNRALFGEAAALGREVIWLHTFGERFVSPKDGRPAGAPRLPSGERPQIPESGSIPSDPDSMPDAMFYDATARRLTVGSGYIENVSPEVWAYEVSGKQVLTQWFSYRQRDRSRPIIGDRRPPSPLGNIQPAGWPAEYTTDLMSVLNVLGLLIKLEPKQADLLQRICTGTTISHADLLPEIKKTYPVKPIRRRTDRQGELLG